MGTPVTHTRQPRKLDKVNQLRALAHPLRVRLLYALIARSAATASMLAEAVGESPALVSYHLRQLANYGFVEEAPELVEDHRQRWWRSVGRGFEFSPAEFSEDPAGAHASTEVKRLLLEHQVERLQQFDNQQTSWGKAWADAAFSADDLLRLSPAETAEMFRELQAVLRRWREHGQTGGDTDREHVMVVLHGFPLQP